VTRSFNLSRMMFSNIKLRGFGGGMHSNECLLVTVSKVTQSKAVVLSENYTFEFEVITSMYNDIDGVDHRRRLVADY